MRRLVFVALLAALGLPASAHASFPGQNGKIAFVRDGDIWTMNPDGAAQVNLTNDAPVQSSPAWSADGNKIAFNQRETSPGPLKVWWMFADASNRTLADNGSTTVPGRSYPTWSPSGTKIAFTAGSGLWTMNPDGTALDHFATGQVNPDWSSEGSLLTVSYIDNIWDSNNLYVVRADGTGSTALTHETNGNISYDTSSWSPDSQRIAYYAGEFVGCGPQPCPGTGFFTVKPDGTDLQQLPAGGAFPAWSPDGTKIASVTSTGIQIMNSDGTGVTTIGLGSDPSWQPLPVSGPAADVLATISDAPDPVPAGGELHYSVGVKNLVGPDNASGVTLTVNLPASVFFVSATPTQGSCSQASNVVTCNVGNLAKGASASVDILVEPRPVNQTTQMTASASVSANETDPVPGNSSDSETTTVQRGGHARPHGATPLIASLVPAYKQCGTGEAGLQHGAPLSYPSCGSPTLTSGYLTTGTPDSNARAANFIGSVKYTALGETLIDPDNGDQSDVQIDVSLTDVRKKADLSDYTGGLLVNPTLRITDRDQGAAGFTSATVVDINLPSTVSCAGTAATNIGSSCILHTTADALVPGSVKEQKRAIWELGQMRVFDGGPDGNPVTADNTLFAVQGVFVP
jgi:uncharacterized repeat protein (TIGR01451 family)